MYKVMIVDDEVLVRIGLKSLINWEDIGYEIVAEAGNGQSAYEKYLALKPDLVITDIKMPKKDGLWLVKKIKENNKDTEIILLTCHDEFEYAREAMKFNISDYILKAEIEDKEILDIMINKKKVLDSKELKNSSIHDVNPANSKNTGYLLGLLLNSKKTIDEVKEAFLESNIDLNSKGYCFLQLDFNTALNDMNSSEQTGKIIYACMELITNKYSEENIKCITKQFGKSITCFLIGNNLNEIKLNRDIVMIRDTIKQYFNITFKSASTPITNTIEVSREFINWLMEAADRLFFIPDNQHLFWAEESKDKKDEFNFDKVTISKLFDFIEDGKKDEITHVLEEIKELFIFRENNSFKAKLAVAHLINDILKKFEDYHDMEENMFTAQKDAMDASDIDQLMNVLDQFIINFIDVILDSRIGNTDLLISKAIDYINDNYYNKISLEEIAGFVGISKFYFSNIFKKEMKINFTSYLNNIRIEKAKQILKNPQKTVSQIYDQVGFNDQQYFTKTFKKYTGMTVTEYRSKYLKESS